MAEASRKQFPVRLTQAAQENLRAAAENYTNGSQNAAVELALWHIQNPCDAWARNVLRADELPAREAALEAWARVVADAAGCAAILLKPYDWAFLARALRPVRLTGRELHPGAALAEVARQAAKENPSWTLLLVDRPDARMEGRRLTMLTGKLGNMDAAEAWAVCLAVGHYWATGGPDGHDESAAWWELAARLRGDGPPGGSEPITSTYGGSEK